LGAADAALYFLLDPGRRWLGGLITPFPQACTRMVLCPQGHGLRRTVCAVPDRGGRGVPARAGRAEIRYQRVGAARAFPWM